MPPTGGPTGAPGCCACGAQSTCGAATLPQGSLSLEVHYWAIYYWEQLRNGAYESDVICADRTLIVPLTYQPAGGGFVEKWVSGVYALSDFPSYQYYYANTIDTPDATTAPYFLLNANCSPTLTGNFKWEIFCSLGTLRLFFYAQKAADLTYYAVDNRFIKTSTYSASPLYVEFWDGSPLINCPGGNQPPAPCHSTYGTTYPFIRSEVVTA